MGILSKPTASVTVIMAAIASACNPDLPVEPPLAVTIAPAKEWSDTLVVRDIDTITVAIKDSAGRALELRNVTWRSSDEGVVTVEPLTPPENSTAADSLGATLSARLTARARGRAEITVSVDQEGAGRAALTAPHVITVLERWIAVSAGGTFTCGLTVDLDAYCWGAARSPPSEFVNPWSGLGVGNATSAGTDVPVPVFGGYKFKAISAGERHACGITTAGLLYCWGHNGLGALGDGSLLNSLIPVVVRYPYLVSSVSAGTEITCVTTNPAGDTYQGQNTFCWGFGGVRGRSYMSSDTDPPTAYVTCAIYLVGLDGICFPRPTKPVQYDVPSGGPDPLTQPMPLRSVSAGADHACAIHEFEGTVWCWGGNEYGQRGLSPYNPDLWTAAADPPEFWQQRVLSVSAAARHTCAIGTDSVAYCWGDNSLGQLGVGSVGSPIWTPTRVASNAKFISISTGGGGQTIDDGHPSGHSCAVSTDGRLYCWGSNSQGELGRNVGSFTSPDTIMSPDGPPVVWTAVSAGGGIVVEQTLDASYPPFVFHVVHTCGLTSRGGIYCWGSNDAGQLGSGQKNTPAFAKPIRIKEP
jgi:alpha-tubulin suppressor-like RCC1 family protein